MSALSRFEHFVEGIVEGSFARIMRTQLQPVQIAKRLERAMETEQSVAAGKIIVPNEYRVAVSPDDFRFYESSRSSWEEELAEYLAGVAKERGLTLFGSPIVLLEAAQGVSAGQVKVAARIVDRPAIATPQPEAVQHTQQIDAAAVRAVVGVVPKGARLLLANGPLAGVTFAINKPMVLIGRAMDNDVVLEEGRVSRYHAEIRLRGDHLYVRDLKSTNGTRINGEEITDRALVDGDRISVAGVDLLFRVGT